MTKALIRAAILTILCGASAVIGIAAESAGKPLGQTELLALVAGAALPENLVQAINTDGLAFHTNDAYRAQLKNAGADDSILKALDGAKVSVASASDGKADPAILQHFGNAGAWIKS